MSASSPPDSFLSLSNLEKLLFAQAIHELSANAWVPVSKLLNSHPLIERPESFFTPEVCQTWYTQLMNEAKLEIPSDKEIKKHAVHLKLAQKYYVARFKELKAQIDSEEKQYVKLVQEIDEIRAGKWDDRIRRANDTAVAAFARKSKELGGSPQASADQETISESQHIASEENADEPQKENVVTSNEVAIKEELAEAGNDNSDISVLSQPPSKGDDPMEIESEDRTEEAEPEYDVKEEEELVGEEEKEDEDGDGDGDEAAEEEEEEEAPVTRTRSSARRGSTVNKRKSTPPDSGRRSKRARSGSDAAPDSDVDGVAGRRRASVSSRTTPSHGDVEKKRFHTVIQMLHSQITQHRSGTIFHNPIRAADAPDYKDIVLQPTDLKTIRGKVRDGQISNSKEYQREIYRMFANAMMYNQPHSEVYHLAEGMMLDCEKMINDFKQTEGFHARKGM